MELIEKNSVSLRGFKWRVREQNERLESSLRQQLGISDIIARLLINRGVHSAENARLFLKSKLYDILPSPFLLQDMQKGVERLADAIMNNQNVTIFGDYDVDGASSSALLFKFLEQINFKSKIYIPDRIKEGYGPSITAFKKIINEKADLIITLDCGVSAIEPIHFAKQSNVDVIVIDHHMVPDIMPEAYAIINPKRHDDQYPYKSIAAVAVTFLFVIALNKELCARNYIKNNIDLMQFLDLVALGTICDVMPLTDINRVFVKKGLSFMNKRSNIGVSALIDVSNIKGNLTEGHICYSLGPKINAGGRLSRSDLGASLLISNDYLKARAIALELDKLNIERREIEKIAVNEAIRSIEFKLKDEDPLVFAYGAWYIGIVGIVASRLKDKYKKPAVVISCKEDGTASGSARSIHGIDFGKIINLAKDAGILIDGGGHAMAGGFSLSVDNIEKFKNYIVTQINEHQNKDEAIELASLLDIDMSVSLSAMNSNVVNDMEVIAPFGAGNPHPRFAIFNIKVQHIEQKLDNFAKIKVSDIFMDRSIASLHCSFFSSSKNEMQNIQLLVNKTISIAGHAQKNNFNKVDFIIDDIIYDAL